MFGPRRLYECQVYEWAKLGIERLPAQLTYQSLELDFLPLCFLRAQDLIRVPTNTVVTAFHYLQRDSCLGHETKGRAQN